MRRLDRVKVGLLVLAIGLALVTQHRLDPPDPIEWQDDAEASDGTPWPVGYHIG